MKILMVFQSAPLPPPLDMGPAKRNFPFFRENIKRHDVSVLAYGSPEQQKLFEHEFGRTVRYVRFIDNRRPRSINLLRRIWFIITGQSAFRFVYSKKLQKAIDEAVASEKFDLIHSCIAMFGFHDFPQGIPLVGDTHNVEYDLAYRTFKESSWWSKPYHYLNYRLGRREEIRNCQKFDVLLTTTERDRKIFLKDLPDKQIDVIQNGVDPTFFLSQHTTPTPRTIVFVGLMNYYPNHHGVHYFLDEIFPKILAKVPDAQFIVVGAKPSRSIRNRGSSNVRVTGFVDDVRPYIARSQVFVIPLRIGGGIRGKALEAMAMKIPIVTTSIGCEGINLRNEESALFADTPETFADAVVRTINDPDLRSRLTANAFHNIVEGYNWEQKGMQLEQTYQSLVHRERTLLSDKVLP